MSGTGGAPMSRSALAKAELEQLMRQASEVRRAGGSIKEAEKQLLAIATKLGQLPNAAGMSLELAQGILQEWGIRPLFDLVNGGMRLEPGQQVFSSSIYSCLYTIAKMAADSSSSAPREMYAWVQDHVRKYMEAYVIPALANTTGSAIFGELRRRWEDHKIITEWLRRVFKSLDDEYIAISDRVTAGSYRHDPFLTSASLRMFKDAAFESRKTMIGGAILVMVNADRNGEVIDKLQVKSVLELLVVMSACMKHDKFKTIKEVESITSSTNATHFAITDSDLYCLDFELPFLTASRDYYSERGGQWAALTAPEFARRIEDSIAAEEQRVASMMHAATRAKIVNVIVQSAAAPHLTTVLNAESSGVRALLRRGTDGFADVGIIFQVAARVPGGTHAFASFLSKHISEMGQRYLADRQTRFRAAVEGPAETAVAGDGAGAVVKKRGKPNVTDTDFIVPLIHLHSSHSFLVSKHLNNDRDCNRAVKEAMEETVNRRLDIEEEEAFAEVSFPSTIDSYVDYLDTVLSGKAMVDGVKMTGKDIDAAWRAALGIFPFFSDKDIFRDAYRLALAKRLLNERSESTDSERAVVGELKSQCGNQFHQTETMINNLASQADWTGLLGLIESSRNKQNTATPEFTIGKMDLSVKVLDKAAWPSFTVLEKVNPPRELAWYMQQFVHHFRACESMNEKKRLEWQYALGTATVVYRLGGKDKDCELSCSTVQMLILLAMNGVESIKLSDLASNIGVDIDKVKMAAAPLTADKRLQQQILKVEGATKVRQAAEADVISSNPDFSKNKKLKHPVPKVDLDVSQTKDKTVKDRKFVIDAALVRVMKARKTMKFEELIAAAIQQLTFFKAEIRDVRRAIEDLIGREYFERDTSSRDTLKYLA